jgi:hypothetical protein
MKKEHSIKRKQVGTFRKVNDNDVQLVFTKACDCNTDNVLTQDPSDISIAGTPICSECGVDYDYDRVEVRHAL